MLRSTGRLICAAIVSDTVMFKSPTCTQRDIDMAKRMARIAGVSPWTLAGRSSPPDQVGKTPRSPFQRLQGLPHRGPRPGIGQITCLIPRRSWSTRTLSYAMDAAKAEYFDMIPLMITDVLREGTELIYLGGRNYPRFWRGNHGQPCLLKVSCPEETDRARPVGPVVKPAGCRASGCRKDCPKIWALPEGRGQNSQC